MRDKPKAFSIYKHFKGKYYQVITVAEHTETGDKFVIYMPLYGERKTYARPLDMFMSEVNRKLYPKASQKYRFEEVDFDKELIKNPIEKLVEKPVEKTVEQKEKPSEQKEKVIEQKESQAEQQESQAEQNEQPTEKSVQNALRRSIEETVEGDYLVESTLEDFDAEDAVDEELMQFLDADSYEKKLEILVNLRNQLDESMLNTMAISLDLEAKEGSIEQKYEDIKYCLTTLERYECNRLR